MRYRRAQVAGGTYFFTVALADCKSTLLIEQAELPDHLHVVWRLPPGDMAYPKRWALIGASGGYGE